MVPISRNDKPVHQFGKTISFTIYIVNSINGRFLTKTMSPCMHIMVCHIPKLLKTFNEIKQFASQGVEKENDDIKMIYHRKSIKHGPTAESNRIRFGKNKI